MPDRDIDRRDEILSEQLGRYSLNISHVSHGTDVIPHAIKLAMDEYFTERALELIEYMAIEGVVCCMDSDGSYFKVRGEVLIKEQLFENFL